MGDAAGKAWDWAKERTKAQTGTITFNGTKTRTNSAAIATATTTAAGTLYCTYAGNCWFSNNGNGSNTDTSGGGGGGGGGVAPGGGGGNPWRPAPPRIDWNALLTRPENTAQDAANSAPSEIDLLNDLLMVNPDLKQELENQGLLVEDENGRVIDFNFGDPDDCLAKRWYENGSTVYDAQGSMAGRAGGERASWGAAYLCGTLEKGDEPQVNPWDWPEGANPAGVKNQKKWARCHLVGRQLGGSGEADNLVTCLQEPTNRSDMLPFENEIRAKVEGTSNLFGWGTDVIYLSIPHYNGSADDGRFSSLSAISVFAIGADGEIDYRCFGNNASGNCAAVTGD